MPNEENLPQWNPTRDIDLKDKHLTCEIDEIKERKSKLEEINPQTLKSTFWEENIITTTFKNCFPSKKGTEIIDKDPFVKANRLSIQSINRKQLDLQDPLLSPTDKIDLLNTRLSSLSNFRKNIEAQENPNTSDLETLDKAEEETNQQIANFELLKTKSETQKLFKF